MHETEREAKIQYIVDAWTQLPEAEQDAYLDWLRGL